MKSIIITSTIIMKVKDISIKNYFFDDIISVKNSDPNNIKTYEKPYKNILIY